MGLRPRGGPPPPYLAENCLSAFDTDMDGDVAAQDEATLLAVPPPSITLGPWTAPVAALVLTLSGLAMLARRRGRFQVG